MTDEKRFKLSSLLGELERNINDHDLWKEYTFQSDGSQVYQNRDDCLLDILGALTEEVYS